MERRIFGLENEYGVTCTLRGQRRLSPDEVARYLFRRVVSWGRSSNVFLANGARLYLDVGSHPEYATPECDSIHELVVHDKAGERILEQLAGRRASSACAEEGIRGDIYLFKNNTDSAGNSYGCHENYLTSRRDDFAHYAEVLIPFLVSRQIYAGAGKVLQTARGAMFCICQRAEHIWEGISSATTRSRPIINTRDEPHADAERYRRLHVIVGDSNMSEYATFLKVGATSDPAADARGAERGAARHDPREPDPGHPRDQPRHHLHPQGAAGQRAGGQRPRHPVGVPEPGPPLRRAPRPLRRRSSRPLDMWEHCLTQIEKDPLSGSTGRPTGSSKYKLIEALPREARPAAQPPQGGAARPAVPRRQPRAWASSTGCSDRGLVDRICDDDEHRRRRSTPRRRPPGPACGASSSARAKERKRDYTVDWVHLKLNDQAQRTVLCKDPFRSHDERVEKLIASL